MKSKQEIDTKDTIAEYSLIRDNLYTDNEGTLYLKSRTRDLVLESECYPSQNLEFLNRIILPALVLLRCKIIEL